VGSSLSGSSSAISINSPASILETNFAGIGGKPTPRRVALVALLVGNVHSVSAV